MKDFKEILNEQDNEDIGDEFEKEFVALRELLQKLHSRVGPSSKLSKLIINNNLGETKDLSVIVSEIDDINIELDNLEEKLANKL